jgi:hypothetical protein
MIQQPSVMVVRPKLFSLIWGMLPIRPVLFAFWQVVIALVLLVAGSSDAWEASIAWWPITAVLANIVCLLLLPRLYRREGLRFWAVFRVRRDTLRQDLLVLLGILIISGPIAFLPNILSATWLFGSQQVALDLFLRPLPSWALLLSLVLWPTTMALSELPFYFAYLMPRLEAQTGHRWPAVLLPAFWLAAQHGALPLIFDGRFILWRLLMFLPFAILVGLVLRWRPQLLPYLVVVHGLLDLATALMIPSLS